MIEPLCFNDVERAISLKRNELSGNGRFAQKQQAGRKHGREEDIEIQAESPYLLLSNSNSAISCSGLSKGQQRTGRWTNEESALVEFLVTKFDQGLLPLPHGIKLNEFLGDMLLCKSSRLTKKMKNAKLSTRSFVLGKACAQFTQRDREKLSMLQESFLTSLTSEPTRLVLKLNLAKQWRTHFYNICLQVGYPHIQEKAWNASLQELERRAVKAEEIVRNIRRRKMGLSSQFDGGNFVNPNFDQSGNDARGTTYPSPASSSNNGQRPMDRVSVVSNEPKSRHVSIAEEQADINYNEIRNSNHGRPRLMSTDFSITSVGYKAGRNRSFSEDFESLMDVLATDEAPDGIENAKKSPINDVKPKEASNFCGPLLQSILKYVETNNLPFHHVDIWVPSFSSGEQGHTKSVDMNQLNLYHAGFCSRHDIDDDTSRMLQEFGVYSSYFSFEPGKGLPGRVYASGIVSWECEVHNKDPSDFVRVEGAELYGVKTAVAIALSSEMVGRIVVILYSCDHVPENRSLARDIVAELTKYSLEPKWKLVLDPGQSPNTQASSSSQIPSNLTLTESRNYSTHTYPTNFASVASDIIVESKNYTKTPDSIKPSSSPVASAVGSSQIPTVPTLQRSSPGIARMSPHSQMDTSHYMHKPPGGEDSELAAFLHQNMPVVNDNSLSQGEVSSSSDAKTLRPYFMSFRLLLLRPSSERTPRENEIIRILKKSFASYSRLSSRDPKELANLLVKDWVCLKSTYSLHEVIMPIRKQSISESTIHSASSMTHLTHKPVSSVPPEIERQVSSISNTDYRSSNTTMPTLHTREQSSQFVSDASEISDQSRNSSEVSVSSSKMLVDHKRYLPQQLQQP